jgi:hypothetical protein
LTLALSIRGCFERKTESTADASASQQPVTLKPGEGGSTQPSTASMKIIRRRGYFGYRKR